MIRSLPTFDGEWKKEFLFISGPWVGDPVKVGRDTFPPLVSDWGHLHPKGTYSLFLLPFLFFVFFFWFFVTRLHAYVCFNFSFPFVAITHPKLNNVLLDRVHRAHCFIDRSFHSLMTLHRLAY